MKKFFVIFLTASLFLTEICSMEKEISQVHDHEEPITGEELVKTEGEEIPETEDLSFDWTSLPEELKYLVLTILAADGDLKTVKNLALVDHKLQALSSDMAVMRLVFKKYAGDNKNMDKIFVGALDCNDLASIELLVEFMQSDNTVDLRAANGRTALMLAARNGRVRLVKLLFNRGADVALHDDFTQTVLMHALSSHDKETIRLILAEGAISIVDHNIAGNSPLINQLFAAVLLGETRRVAILLERNHRLKICDSNYMTPLMFAAYCGYTGIAKLLIKGGFDINAQDEWGKTALIIALVAGYQDIANLLIENNADVNPDVKNPNYRGLTPLMIACYKRNRGSAKTLIQKGAFVNAKDKQNNTALKYAAYNGDKDIVTMLIDAGADSTIKDSAQKTALDIAWEQGYLEIVSLLESCRN